METDPKKRWRQLAALFDEAVALSPDQRRAYLDRTCGDDPDLRRQVAELLESSDRATGFLEQPVQLQNSSLLAEVARDLRDDGTTETTAASLPPGTPDAIGPYRLLQKIGEGGMGEVWLAEQTAPVRRRVALKLIKAGMDTKQVVARFEAERQALALMDHTSIAKV